MAVISIIYFTGNMDNIFMESPMEITSFHPVFTRLDSRRFPGPSPEPRQDSPHLRGETDVSQQKYGRISWLFSMGLEKLIWGFP